MSWYRARVTISGNVWDITQGAPPGYGPVRGLSIGWAMPRGKLWPTQPDPVTATLSLAAARLDDLAWIHIGSHVVVQVWVSPTAPGPAFTFAGRVTDLAGAPHQQLSNGDLPVLVDVTAVDHVSDLEYDVDTGGGWPQESIHARLDHAFGGGPALGPAAAPGMAAQVPPRPAGAVTALDVIREYLTLTVGPYPWEDTPASLAASTHPILSPRVDAAGSFLGWAYDQIPRTPPPLTVTLDTSDPHRRILHAGLVDFTSSWYANKARTRTVTQFEFVGKFALGEDPPPGYLYHEQRMAAFYNPPTAGPPWLADRFRYYLDREPPPRLAALAAGDWLPDHAAAPGAAARHACYWHPAAIVGIPPSWRPATPETPVFAGQLSEVAFTLDAKARRFWLDVTISPWFLDPGNVGFTAPAGAYTWADIALDHPTLTWAQLDPALTWLDTLEGIT